MEDNDRKMAQHYIRVILNILIPAVGTVLICTIGPKLLRFFMPFVVGWIVALIANPLLLSPCPAAPRSRTGVV